VEALNVALKDEKLAVSLVEIYVNECFEIDSYVYLVRISGKFLHTKNENSENVNSFEKLMFSFLISDVTSNAMQWKMYPMGKDN
jgi:hypothetical protein